MSKKGKNKRTGAPSRRLQPARVSGRDEAHGSSTEKSGRAKDYGSLELAEARRNFGRWRALSLSLVYLVFAAHIIHWKITGSTLAPLELNEVMYTLELGIVTAGFLFMCSLVLGTFIFGRFFCSWTCHIMVLQDLCGWILRKLGIRQKAIRSRMLLLVPPFTAAYMFLWPQIKRAYYNRAFPEFHMRTDAEGWASFTTDNFWRNLPGPWIIAVTFLVCGFAIVYLLGSRTFCTYVCPYGSIFAFADRFAPGRIRVDDSCKQCGTCTAVCTSGVRVHEEVKKHGMIVNPACLKDLDCVGHCPQSALRYSFGKPSLFKSYSSGGRFGLPYDFSLREEALAAVVFLFVVFSFRGLYGQMPFLLSLGCGIIVAYLFVVAIRLVTKPNLMLSTLRLKELGRVTSTGRAFAGFAMVVAAFVGHSAFIRYHEFFGLRDASAVIVQTGDSDSVETSAERARKHLLLADRWGLFFNFRLDQAMVAVAAELERDDELTTFANRFLERYPDRFPESTVVRLRLGQALARQGRVGDAAGEFHAAFAAAPKDQPAYHQLDGLLAALAKSDSAVAGLRKAATLEPELSGVHQALAWVLAARREHGEAVAALHAAIALAPPHAGLHVELGGRLADLGQIDDAIKSQRKAIELDPNLAVAHRSLGVLLAQRGEFLAAADALNTALALDREQAATHAELGGVLAELGRLNDAVTTLTKAVELDPALGGAHYNLGVILARLERYPQAITHYERAIALNPGDADLHNNLGFALFSAGHTARAKTCFETAIRVNPKSADAHFNLGRLYASQDNAEEADRHFRKAVELDPRYLELLQGGRSE